MPEVVQELLPNATTAPTLNRTLGANWFNWRNSSGQMHQVWYDDPVSLGMKYNRTQEVGMSVVGMWVADATGFDEEATKAMWAALP